MRELVGGKNTIGRTAIVLKKPHKATFNLFLFPAFPSAPSEPLKMVSRITVLYILIVLYISKRNMSLKNPVTPPGIDPGTVRLVAQRLNHYAIPGPTYLFDTVLS